MSMDSKSGRKTVPMASLAALVLCSFLSMGRGLSQPPPAVNCDYMDAEVNAYKPLVDRIIAAVSEGGFFQSHTHATLSHFVDKFGPRLTGSEALERSIDYMLNETRDFGLDVWTENVTAPKWERISERVSLVEPWVGNIPALALGGSVSTPEGGITAEIVVVRDFTELAEKSAQVSGKIVVFNQDFISYGDSVKYRSKGASMASKHGALATLIRSITPFSLGTPHTGHQSYDAGVKPIPTLCIPPEHAEMLYRMFKRGESRVVVSINLTTRQGTAITRNTIVDLKGRESPDKLVIVSGHLDSWDVGQGAMDDGGGAFISWNSLVLMKSLNLKPRRTVRAILWTGEEQGYVGATEYARRHAAEMNKVIVAMESDEGTFTPHGLLVKGSLQASCILKKILRLFKPINATQVKSSPYYVGSDIALFQAQNVTGVALLNENERYFWYHHSAADTMAVLDPVALDYCTALWGGVAYILADMSIDLPRT